MIPESFKKDVPLISSSPTIQEEKFIALRSDGETFAKIGEVLGVSKSTLVRWSQKFKDEISNLKNIRYEAFIREHQASHEQRLRILAKTFQKVSREIEARDLSDASTPKLIELSLKLADALEKSYSGPKFAGEIDLINMDFLGNPQEWIDS